MGSGAHTGEIQIVGRGAELEVVGRFLDRAHERSSVLRLDGEAGIGKTTVWQEGVALAREMGFRVLSCRPGEAETKLALSGVADLLEEVEPESLSVLSEPQRKALDVALLREPPGGGSPDPRTLSTGVRNVLAALAEGRPVVVAIDDVQWLDKSSAGVLGFALRRLTAARVSWLFSARIPEPAGLAADEFVPTEDLTVLTLGPLTLAALHHLLKDRLGEPLSRPDLVRLHQATGGNPLFAIEIVRAGGPIGSTPAELAVPDRLRELLAQRMPALSSEAGEALLASAALSRPNVDVVERASSAQAVASAEETRLIRVRDGRISFAHPLYASVIYEAASETRRRELHRRLAGLVDDPEQRARHLAASAAEPSGEVALALEEAATLARRRGAWEAASELLERASALTPPGQTDDRDRRLIAAAEHQIHAGGRSRARRLLEGALADDPPAPLRAEALRLLGEVDWHVADFPSALAALSEALESADEARLLASIELALAWMQPTFSDYSGGAPLAHRALQHAREAGDTALEASALGLSAQLAFLTGEGVDWEMVERSLALEDPEAIIPMLWQPSPIAAALELWTDRVSDAREHLDQIRITASEHGDESDLAFVLIWLSWLEARSGNLDAATSLAGEMATSAGLGDSKAMQAFALGQRALVHAYRGEADEARALAAEATTLNEVVQQPQVVLWTAAAIGHLELSLGNPEAAWSACEPIAAGFELQGIAEPAIAFPLPDAIEAMVALGRLDRAEPLLDSFLERAGKLDRISALATGGRCRAQLLASRGDLEGAEQAIEAALAAHARIQMPLDLGRTLLVKGQIERRARRRGLAKTSLDRSREIFEELGAERWAERAREEEDRLGLRRSAPDELSEAERRVAEAAASGLTNKEVAASLFLSPKTVEAHLSSVYRKLGISSRAELGARMTSNAQN